MSSTARQEPVQIPVAPEVVVSGMLAIPEWWPTGARLGVVLAHDVGGSMNDDLVAKLHVALAERGSLALRFNFPFAEQQRKRPDATPLLERTFRAATETLQIDPQNAPARVIVAGFGLGARIAAEAVTQGLKTEALVCLAYPLHPSGKPARARADALFRIICPALFVQGTRDSTCKVDRLQQVLRRVGAPSKLHLVEDADHGFGVVPRSNRAPEEVQAEVIDAVASFCARVTGQA